MASPLSAVNKKSTLGFTLVEMVTVILILGILVVGVSSFIIFGTRIFVESSSVDQVLSQSRFAVERMTRELRSALPNSVRLNSDSLTYQCVEFVPIEASTTYLAMPIIPAAAASTGIVILDNTASAIRVNQFAWIYPLVDADVYSSARQKRAQIKTPPLTLANQVTLTFTAPTRFAEASPRQRIYFGSSPVSYCFEKGPSGNELQLLRYAGYSFNAIQPNPAAMPATMGTGVLMAQSVANVLNNGADLPLILTPSSLVNNAMVHLQPRFNVNGETFQYRHQVQVINVP